ncbi:MAG: acyltransferase family protein [Lachnospiraceae bacterium]|nr:acyltransferase family protein [Lachnospiraceae bacterium]
MEVRIQKREAGYCNLKLLLIFLVVYGHLIEPQIGESRILYEIYRLIYLFHMPLFAFLSGMFLKGQRNSRKQMKRTFLIYVLMQSAVWIWMQISHWGRVTWNQPYWHLWYLLSLGYWAAAAFGWNWLIGRFPSLNQSVWKAGIILLAAGIGCIVGGIKEVNRIHSLSRSIVFFPYVLAGLFCPLETAWKRYRGIGLAVFLLAALVYWKWGRTIPATFFYQAASFGSMGVKKGIWFRLVSYCLGILFSFCLLTWIPQRRFRWSKAGANTLGIYICHAFVVRVIWKAEMSGTQLLLSAPWIAGFLVWFFYKLFQWSGRIYQIVPSNHGGKRIQKERTYGGV